MFARHLMTSGGRVSVPIRFTPWDIGSYWCLGSYVTYDYDRGANMLYRYRAKALTNPFGFTPTATGSDGTVPLIWSDETTVKVYGTNSAGPAGNAVATYGRPPSVVWQVYGRAACRYTLSDGVYTLVHVDLASGTSWPMGKVSRLQDWWTGDDLFVGTDADFFGYPSTGYAKQLPAANGRVARVSIARQVYEDAPAAVLQRMRADASPEPLYFFPNRRPMTTATRVRGYAFADSSGGGSQQDMGPRRLYHGVSMATRTVTTFELEIGPALETTTYQGQAVTRHQIRFYSSTLVGVMSVSRNKGIGFLVIRRTDNDRSADDYLQYVNTDGTPSGEFIKKSAGAWALPNSAAVTTGDLPLFLTTNYVVAQGSGTTIVLYDYAGNRVGTGNRNQNTDGTFSDFSFVYLPQLDALVYPVNDYAVTYASFDFGKTWQRIQAWGARGSTKPTSPRPPGDPDYAELASCRPLFVT
ncbi:hypothetical protein A3862_05220 [Methylobacterium sp. XJLW]|uniref:hypothetical protein n=1 Tax=Methylobacterium sp. XJLW TaxID=739141 RepID=UPI000DAAEEBC|nr:hypothetical protein [Methylobacterium sp. XJLW]AWV14983.1 hypothetical protein A3862_05220 [Methylobacterium sp. XJLW]